MNNDACGFDKEKELLKLHGETTQINNSGVCPVCGELIEDYGSMEFEGDMGYFPWHCHNCNTDGEEWYNLEFAGHNYYDENGK